jgi:hypothetical protein
VSVTHENKPDQPTPPSSERSPEPKPPHGGEPKSTPGGAEPSATRGAGELRNALAGLLLAVGSLAFLGWNEHRTVDREMALAALLDSAVTVREGRVDEALNGKLVLVEGQLLGSGPLRDGKIPYETKALRLRRTVQMYQWEARQETREETGPDGQTRTVESQSYTRVWSEGRIESDEFEVKTHANPEFPFETRIFDAEAPKIGAHRIPSELIGSIDAWEPVPAEDHVAGRAKIGRPVYAKGDYFFVGSDPNSPEIGDLRVAHQIVPEGIVASAIGQQSGHALTAFKFRDETIEPSLLAGTHDAHALYAAGPSDSRPLVWIGRVGGALLACLAFFLVLGVLPRHREKEGLIGDFARAGILISSVVLGLSISLIVAGSIWVSQGLYLGGAFLTLGALILVLGLKQRLSLGRSRAPAERKP